MELIGSYGSPFVRRVAVTLHLYGMAFTQLPLGTVPDAAAIRAKNPLGRVPALVLDDGEVLIDSLFIIDWMDEQAGARALVPRAGAERRRVNRLTALAAAVAGPWLLGAALTHADIAAACAVLAMRADMPHLAPEGRFPHLDVVVREAAGLPAFAATAV